MVFSFARVGAVRGMQVSDYYQNGRRPWIWLHEKGGKFHEVPVHHSADDYLHAYIAAAGIAEDCKQPLWRTTQGRIKRLTANALQPREALAMIKRRAEAASLPLTICNHTIRATGITAYMENGGTIEKAQTIAAHESPRTTKLYDRRSDQISLDEIERIFDLKKAGKFILHGVLLQARIRRNYYVKFSRCRYHSNGRYSQSD